jgi:hypothetical protein
MRRPTIATWLTLVCAAGCNQTDPAAPDDGMAGMGADAGGASAGRGVGGDGGRAGGGAGDGAGAGSAGSGATLDYFPLLDGASWTYLHSNGGWNEAVSMEALSDGRYLQTSSADPAGVSSESTFAVTDGEVLRVAEETFADGVLAQSTEYDPGFLRFSQLWAEERPGFSERRAYERTETRTGSSPKPPSDRAHIFTLESISEDVTVPAGSFRNCVRVRRQRDYEVMAADGTTVTEDQEKLYWFCQGVGKVREENALTGTTESLMEYDLPK